jgi:ketosteroid isomerase-like protein
MELRDKSARQDQILAPIVAERLGIAEGDAGRYFAALADDALFLPPNTTAKTGAELRNWLGEFMKGFRIEWLSFVSSEVQVFGEVAYHIFSYTWRVTPVAGGEGKVTSGKGLHILRRQSDGEWKISREIWNSTPGA